MRVCLLLLLATPAAANDGFGGLSATGLSFGKTAEVAMEAEDLFIGPDRISVDYTFRNLTDHEVTGEVIFPLPPISLADLQNEDWNLPQDRNRPNLVNFSVSVEGSPVAVAIDRIAVIEPQDRSDAPPAAAYDTPGQDVTARLAGFGIPLTVDGATLDKALKSLPVEARKALVAQGLADADDPAAADPNLIPRWSVILRYHWTQSFPAGAALHLSQSYENHPPGGIFTWNDPPKDDYMQEIAKQYCIDPGTSKAIAHSLTRPPGSADLVGQALNISYVLRTANSWAGPIGRFRLTLDKGSPRNVVSLCAEGVKKTGPTRFVVEKTDFAPDRDLDILIVRPAPG